MRITSEEPYFFVGVIQSIIHVKVNTVNIHNQQTCTKYMFLPAKFEQIQIILCLSNGVAGFIQKMEAA